MRISRDLLVLSAALVAVSGAAAQPARWTLRELTTIGGADSGPASFDYLVSVVADAEGNIYVADRDAVQIRAFDERGRHLWTAGRQGQGPGEFVRLFALAWLGDTLLAGDDATGRINRFSRTGQWLGQLPLPAPSQRQMTALIRAGNDLYGRSGTGRGAPPGYRYLWLNRGRVDTIGFVARESRPTITCRSGRINSGVSLPYPPPRITVVAPGGLLATAATARYRIALVNLLGDTVRTIEKAHRPIRISDEQWADANASLRLHLARGESCDGTRFDRPDQLPAIQDMFYDADGRLWVETWTSTVRLFDIFDPAGRHIATSNAPDRRLLHPFIRGDRVYTLVTDSLGVNAVKVFAIQR